MENLLKGLNYQGLNRSLPQKNQGKKDTEAAVTQSSLGEHKSIDSLQGGKKLFKTEEETLVQVMKSNTCYGKPGYWTQNADHWHREQLKGL